MRIFNEDNQKAINNVSLFLTIEEAKEMFDSLEQLINNFKNDADHTHINDSEYKREIMVCLYSESNLQSFNKEIQKLINENE